MLSWPFLATVLVNVKLKLHENQNYMMKVKT